MRIKALLIKLLTLNIRNKVLISKFIEYIVVVKYVECIEN